MSICFKLDGFLAGVACAASALAAELMSFLSMSLKSFLQEMKPTARLIILSVQ